MQRRRSAILAAAHRLELPTWLLALTIYGGWLGLTYFWHALPIWEAVPLGGWLCAWHMSLQHELIHGHPTSNPRVNTLLAMPPLSLWLPFPLYRDSHLRHHRDDTLTDPIEDPESTYFSAEAWRQAGPVLRWLHRVCTTLAGRILLGPPLSIVFYWTAQFRLIGRGTAPWRIWLDHALFVGLVLGWVCLICRIDPLTYLACFVYPGAALSMIRSLAEHRAADRPADRTAVVEHAGLLGLLFLNNNLHLLHHLRPSLPWYVLPSQWRLTRATLLAGWRGPLYRGYRDVACRYALRPHHPGPHPGILVFSERPHASFQAVCNSATLK